MRYHLEMSENQYPWSVINLAAEARSEKMMTPRDILTWKGETSWGLNSTQRTAGKKGMLRVGELVFPWK